MKPFQGKEMERMSFRESAGEPNDPRSRLSCKKRRLSMWCNLKKRIEVMHNGTPLRVDFAKKAMLATAGVAALAVPIALGVLVAPFTPAQSTVLWSQDKPRPAF